MSLPLGLIATDSDSRIHRLDPRLRIVTALGLALTTLSLGSTPALLVALLGAILLTFLARLDWRTLLKRLLLLEGFMLLVLLSLPFTTPGETWFELGPLIASQQGGWHVLHIILKAHTVVLILLTLIATIELVTLGHALAHLKVPDKLVHLFLFTVRYIAVLYEEYRRLRLAMKARGFVFTTSRHSWRSVGWLVGMLLVKSLERAERIVAAMRCRGFHGRFYLLDELSWQTADRVAGRLFILAASLLLITDQLLVHY